MNVFISGSLAYDRIMDYPGRFADKIDVKKKHVLNISFHIPAIKVSYGGTAGNIAYTLALLKIKPALVGSLGRDGAEYRRRLQKLGADTRFLTIAPDVLSASAYVITDRDDNQVTGFVFGAMSQPPRLPRARKGDLAIIAAQGRHMVALAKHYQKLGVTYLFDPGQAMTALSRADLKYCLPRARVIIGNDYEVAVILKRAQHTPHPRQFLVTTLGARGSRITCGSKAWRIPAAKPARVVDPTGAGDAYRAGFIKGFIEGYPIAKVGRLASVVAVYAVEKYGTQNHRFSWEGVKRRYYRNFKTALYK